MTTLSHTFQVNHFFTADAMSRAPAPGNHDFTSFHNETEAFAAAVVSNLPLTPDRQEGIRKAQAAD